jgi:hypothetical protein
MKCWRPTSEEIGIMKEHEKMRLGIAKNIQLAKVMLSPSKLDFKLKFNKNYEIKLENLTYHSFENHVSSGSSDSSSAAYQRSISH